MMDDTPHGKVRVARLGQGPPVVLLHGYPDNLQIWARMAPRLASGLEVRAFDWPGMGWSAPWPGEDTPAGQAARLRDLLDHWGLERAAVVGMDMGGQAALAFAALHPARITRLAVMNTLAFGDGPTSWEIAVLRRLPLNGLILRGLPRIVFQRAVASSLPRGLTLPDEIARDLWSAFRQPAVLRFVARLCAGYERALPSLPELYARIRCPTLVLWGERDRHFPPPQGERLARTVPGAEHAIIPGGEHWMAWHAADEVAARLATFLRTSPGINRGQDAAE
jgi:pimeloyl-ACP methyl ester carboxylesterase